eukprot:357412-Chlamydomonas_euryale.AAC.7
MHEFRTTMHGETRTRCSACRLTWLQLRQPPLHAGITASSASWPPPCRSWPVPAAMHVAIFLYGSGSNPCACAKGKRGCKGWGCMWVVEVRMQEQEQEGDKVPWSMRESLGGGRRAASPESILGLNGEEKGGTRQRGGRGEGRFASAAPAAAAVYTNPLERTPVADDRRPAAAAHARANAHAPLSLTSLRPWQHPADATRSSNSGSTRSSVPSHVRGRGRRVANPAPQRAMSSPWRRGAEDAPCAVPRRIALGTLSRGLPDKKTRLSAIAVAVAVAAAPRPCLLAASAARAPQDTASAPAPLLPGERQPRAHEG